MCNTLEAQGVCEWLLEEADWGWIGDHSLEQQMKPRQCPLHKSLAVWGTEKASDDICPVHVNMGHTSHTEGEWKNL